MLRGIILAAATSLCCLEAFASPRVELLYHYTKGSDPIYESKSFLPIYTNKSAILFSDVRTVSNFKNMAEVNLGLGVRKKLSNINTIIGAYYFYDQRNEDGLYRQNTVGMEVLAQNFEARANIYMPFGAGDNVNQLDVVYDKKGAYTINKHVKGALKGFDTELGFVMPTQYFSFGVYGGLYKFFNENKDNNISGKKIRGEFSADGFLPYNLVAAIGAEYDYSDDADKRAASVSFKVGIPLSGKGDVQSQDARMTKSAVRDLHIRIIDNQVVVPAEINAQLNDNSITFDKVLYVSDEQELRKALNEPIKASEDIAIVLSDNIAILKPLEIKDNYYLISKSINFKFNAVGDQNITTEKTIGDNKTLLYASSVKVADASGKMVEVTPSISDDQIAGLKFSKIAKYSHDGVEYTILDVVNDESSFISALAKDKSIIVLDSDIDLSKKVNIAKDKVILGLGELQVEDSNGVAQNVVLTERKQLKESAGSVWDSSDIKANIVVDGINWNLDSSVVGSGNFGLTVKNSIINSDVARFVLDFDYSSNPNRLLENVVLNRVPIDSGAILFDDNATVNVNDFEVNVQKSTDDEKQALLNTKTLDVKGDLKLSHYNNLLWASSHYAVTNPKIIFNKGSKVIVEDKTKNEVVTYNVTDTVTLGSDSAHSSLYKSTVNTDLSTLSDKIVKVTK